MKRVSLRTLVLLLELLAAVVSLQYVNAIRSPKPGAVWVADDCASSPAAPADAGRDITGV